jgi:hypothetical protein
MFDLIIGHLETADEFERNAKRLLESGTRPPNWTHTYIECLGDACRERAAARKLIVLAHNNPWKVNQSADGAEDDRRGSEIRDMTLGQLIRLAASTRSAPAGSQRMRHSAQRMYDVAKLLRLNQTMAQLLWWCADLEPVPPGKTVISFDEQGAAK